MKVSLAARCLGNPFDKTRAPTSPAPAQSEGVASLNGAGEVSGKAQGGKEMDGKEKREDGV